MIFMLKGRMFTDEYVNSLVCVITKISLLKYPSFEALDWQTVSPILDKFSSSFVGDSVVLVLDIVPRSKSGFQDFCSLKNDILVDNNSPACDCIFLFFYYYYYLFFFDVNINRLVRFAECTGRISSKSTLLVGQFNSHLVIEFFKEFPKK